MVARRCHHFVTASAQEQSLELWRYRNPPDLHVRDLGCCAFECAVSAVFHFEYTFMDSLRFARGSTFITDFTIRGGCQLNSVSREGCDM